MTIPAWRPPQIESFSALLGYLREDYTTNGGVRADWTFWKPGFQAVAIYRIGVWCDGLRSRLLRAPLRRVVWFLAFRSRNLHGIEISSTSLIGRRFCIAHQHGIVIHSRAVIGDDCLIRQGVTIGAAGGGAAFRGAPRLGDRVQIGAGAVLAGAITIGDDVTIGPNAVVMQNVPAGSVVTSPQSRIMSPPPRRAERVTKPEPLDASPSREPPDTAP